LVSLDGDGSLVARFSNQYGHQDSTIGTYTVGDVIEMRLDMDLKQITFYKNKAASTTTSLPANKYSAGAFLYDNDQVEFLPQHCFHTK
jgi:hypothetical protein